jgi:transcriptional regulator with XRE-family HTH domain
MEEVRRLRLEKGWNQNELAFHADLAPSVISLVETGKREPNATTLRKLADALGVDIPDLFRGPEAPKEPRPSPARLLEEAGAPTRWFVVPHEEWLEAFESQSTAEAAQKLVDIAVQMEDEFGKLMSLIHAGAPNLLGHPTLPREYLDFWRQATQRRIRTYFALEKLEEDSEAPEDLRERARMLLQCMTKTNDEEYARLLPPPKRRTAGRSYV